MQSICSAAAIDNKFPNQRPVNGFKPRFEVSFRGGKPQTGCSSIFHIHPAQITHSGYRDRSWVHKSHKIVGTFQVRVSGPQRSSTPNTLISKRGALDEDPFLCHGTKAKPELLGIEEKPKKKQLNSGHEFNLAQSLGDWYACTHFSGQLKTTWPSLFQNHDPSWF